MSFENLGLAKVGLGILPSERSLVKERNDEEELMQRKPIQYVEEEPKPQPPADDDPFSIFTNTSKPAPVAKAAPAVKAAPAPRPTPPTNQNVFGFAPGPQPAPVAAAGGFDPFAGFTPTPAPVAASTGFDPFAGFAAQPAAPASSGMGFPADDDFFSPPAASAAPGAIETPDIAALNIKDKAPPLPTEGTILARLSARTLFVKEWQEIFWLVQGYHFYIYRNKDDFKFSKPGEGIKKDILITGKMRCLPIKSKEYSGQGYLYNFFLEEVEDYGANQVAKFASPDKEQLEIVHKQLEKRIRKAKAEGH